MICPEGFPCAITTAFNSDMTPETDCGSGVLPFQAPDADGCIRYTVPWCEVAHLFVDRSAAGVSTDEPSPLGLTPGPGSTLTKMAAMIDTSQRAHRSKRHLREFAERHSH